MAIDFKTFNQVAPLVANAKKPVLLRGRHGVGKSCVVYQTAAVLGLPVVERRASQMTEGDLVGLPSTDGNVTSFNPPDWYNEACENPVLLFLDEVDRATTEVRQGIFELTDSRKLNGCTLHEDTLVFAAVNGGEHGAQYQVGEMDPAELDRWTVFDVEPTVEDWLDWANGNVDGIIWDFINNNRNHLEHVGEFEPNKVYPSRRSWDRLSDTLVTANLLGEDAKEKTDTIFHLGVAFCGFEAAVALTDFVKTYERQVTVADILEHGNIEKTAAFGINEHAALVEKMEAEKTFSELLTEPQVQNLAAYFVTVPSEIAMKLWTVMGEGNVDNTVALHQTEVDGTAVSSFLVELLTGQPAS
jgi:MoxR-like ATPase|tara:strand:+ start:646 stop:1716 length:1071 start_codon:yes stop_codon:yes gene_type:complete